MTLPTKAQIDALVEAMPPCNHGSELSVMFGRACTLKSEVASTLYLAAGLHADGSEKAKPQRVVAVLYGRDSSLKMDGAYVYGTWDGTTFTPDGAS